MLSVRALVAAASTGLFVALAWNHPLFPWLVLGLGLALAAWAARDPGRAMAVLPALLPAVDLMPWTGWISFEEFDLAVLCVAAGGYARWAARRPLAPPTATAPLSAADAWGLKMLVLLGMAAAVAVSMWRGFDGAGGFVWGWWQAYHEPMNSLRVAKSFWLALLLLPLWRAVQRVDPVRAAHDVSLGLSAGLLVVALLTVWERWAYTGLLNFSSDYRTTALFWEMHVGGAALDVRVNEPPGKDDPLAGAPNLLLTPHVAGITDEAQDRISVAVAEDVLRVLRGERPLFAVK